MMRISTVTMFEQSLSSMNRQQSGFLKVGQQIASGRRVLTPADDPQAASRAVRVSQAQAVNEQHTDSRVSARNRLSQAESVLGRSVDYMVRAKTLLVQAANDPLNDADRDAIAAELRSVYETLIGQANATDGAGSYLFGGYEDQTPPFVRVETELGVTAVEYRGDSEVRQQRIDATRLLAVGAPGPQLFQSVVSGLGYVARAEKLAASSDNVDLGTQTGYERNSGTMRFRGPEVVDPLDANFGESITLEFSRGATLDATAVIGGDPITGFGDLTGGDAAALPAGPYADSAALVAALESTDQIERVDDVNGDGSELIITYVAGATDDDFTLSLETVSVSVTAGSALRVTGTSEDGTVVLAPTAIDDQQEEDQTVLLAGLSMSWSGDPAEGDQLQLRPADAEEANQDLFKSLKDAIDVLELDQGTSESLRAHAQNTISTVMRELDNSMDNVLSERASIGASLNELDLVDTVGTNRGLNYAESLSALVDLDYGEALTEYSIRQVGLQAAQKAFVDIQGLSLFDYLR